MYFSLNALYSLNIVQGEAGDTNVPAKQIPAQITETDERGLGSRIRGPTICIQHQLHLLDVSVAKARDLLARERPGEQIAPADSLYHVRQLLLNLDIAGNYGSWAGGLPQV